jgi:hypothetical protein
MNMEKKEFKVVGKLMKKVMRSVISKKYAGQYSIEQLNQ